MLYHLLNEGTGMSLPRTPWPAADASSIALRSAASLIARRTFGSVNGFWFMNISMDWNDGDGTSSSCTLESFFNCPMTSTGTRYITWISPPPIADTCAAYSFRKTWCTSSRYGSPFSK